MTAIPGRFGAVLTAMVTPFDANGAVDLDAAATLARWLVANGNDGLVVVGTTGESATLSDAEKADVWRAVVEAVTVPVIAGATSNDTAHSLHLVHAAQDAGAAGILAVTPYYNRPSQAGLTAHFTAIASATHLPVMLYDVGFRTGRDIAHDTSVALARSVSNIVAIKDAKKDPVAASRLLRDAPGGFELYSGDCSLTLPLLAIGACGVVGVSTHWTGVAQAEMVNSYAKGDVARAQELNAALLVAYDFESGDDNPNPVPTKAVMRQLGLPVGQCRLPMGDAPDGLDARAAAHLKELGALAAPPFAGTTT